MIWTPKWWVPGGWVLDEMDEERCQVQTSSCEMNCLWGCGMQHGDNSQQYYSVYLKITRRIDFESFHGKKKIFITFYGDRW